MVITTVVLVEILELKDVRLTVEVPKLTLEAPVVVPVVNVGVNIVTLDEAEYGMLFGIRL